MQLLFYYELNEETVRGIQEVCVSFSKDQHFFLDKVNNTIRFKQLRYPLPSHFFDEEELIYNVTFFVGDNGAGKTSLIHHILDTICACKKDENAWRLIASEKRLLLFEDESYYYLAVYCKNSEYKMSFYKIEKKECLFSIPIDNKSLSNNIWSDEERSSFMSSLTCIYLSNAYSPSDLKLPKDVFNYSLAAEVDNENGWFNVLEKEMRFVLNYDFNRVSKNSYFSLPVPQYLYICLKSQRTDDNYFDILYDICKHLEDVYDQKDFADTSKNLVHRCVEIAEKWKMNPEMEKYLVDSPVDHTLNLSLRLPVWCQNSSVFDGNKELNSFFNSYKFALGRLKESEKNNGSIIFSWGLSTGEESILRCMSNLYCMLWIYQGQSVKAKTDSILCFWDEVDNGFHPEWQRLLLGIWTEFMTKIFGGVALKIQLFATTHSPLLLGDVPGNSIVGLKKDGQTVKVMQEPDHKTTFGENIYTILKDGFLLERGAFGGISQQKIKEILETTRNIKAMGDYYNSREEIGKKLDYLENVAQLFSGIFYKKLIFEINSAREKLKDDRVAEIERQIRLLEKERENLLKMRDNN